jgi:hypothetical protein
MGEETIIVVPGADASVISEVDEETPPVFKPAVVEPVAEAAVEIARIEAERDITVAAIQAETTEAALEAQTNAELERCRTRIAELETVLAEKEKAIAALSTQPLIVETVEEAPPPNPPFESASNVETPVSPVPAAEPAPEPKVRHRALRWI